jgi:ParB family chromosome partitioning protein
MNRRRGGLGSGLDALFSPNDQPNMPAIRELPIDQIRPNQRQPRIVFDQQALEDLATSIREHGVIQPLIVSERSDGFELIAGERRWRAAQCAQLATVPAIVREAAPQQLLELTLIENVQRADLNALEEARAYQALSDDFGLSDSEIARRIGKGSRESIANARRLLQLDASVQEALLQGRITAGHGRAILKVKTANLQQAMLHAIEEHDLSVRLAERFADLIIEYGDAERAVAALRPAATATPNTTAPDRVASKRSTTKPPVVNPDDDYVRRSLEQILGTPVSLSRTDRELRVTIAFHTEEKLQEFFEWINQRV